MPPRTSKRRQDYVEGTPSEFAEDEDPDEVDSQRTEDVEGS